MKCKNYMVNRIFFIFMISLLYASEVPYSIKELKKPEEINKLNSNFISISINTRLIEEKILLESDNCIGLSPKREGVFCYDTNSEAYYIGTGSETFKPLAITDLPNSILNRNTLQSGATFYVSSGSVDGQALLARTSGNVGIGTLNLTEKLTVGGSISPTGNIYTTGVVSGILGQDSTGYIRNTATLQASSTFYVSSGSIDGQALFARTSGNVGIGTNNPLSLFHVGSSLFNVLSSGLVGIGTVSPAAGYELHIRVSGSNNADLRLTSGGGTDATFSVVDGQHGILSTTNNLQIQDTGNVGIGTAAAEERFDVYNGTISYNTNGHATRRCRFLTVNPTDGCPGGGVALHTGTFLRACSVCD